MQINAVFKAFEAVLLVGILLALSVTLLLAFVDIAYVIYVKIMAPPVFIVDANGLMELFSLILILLIGLELVDHLEGLPSVGGGQNGEARSLEGEGEQLRTGGIVFDD